MTIATSGIVATSQTLASQAAAMTLARGGSAVDAAIAANAVLSVVEPMMCGIGGDLFAIHRDAKTGELTGINASGPAPAALTLDRVNDAVPRIGIHTATIPGAVDGWAKMHDRFGRLPWADLFAPAIYFADRGFPVTELIQYDWLHTRNRLEEDPAALRMLLACRPTSARSSAIANWQRPTGSSRNLPANSMKAKSPRPSSKPPRVTTAP